MLLAVNEGGGDMRGCPPHLRGVEREKTLPNSRGRAEVYNNTTIRSGSAVKDIYVCTADIYIYMYICISNFTFVWFRFLPP